MARKPQPREAPLSIRLTADERAWIESQLEPGETVRRALKRMLHERRLLAGNAEVARELDLLRRARAALRIPG